MTTPTKPPWPFQGRGRPADDAEIEAVALLVKRAARMAFRHGLWAGIGIGIVAGAVSAAAILWAIL